MAHHQGGCEFESQCQRGVYYHNSPNYGGGSWDLVAWVSKKTLGGMTYQLSSVAIGFMNRMNKHYGTEASMQMKAKNIRRNAKKYLHLLTPEVERPQNCQKPSKLEFFNTRCKFSSFDVFYMYFGLGICPSNCFPHTTYKT